MFVLNALTLLTVGNVALQNSLQSIFIREEAKVNSPISTEYWKGHLENQRSRLSVPILLAFASTILVGYVFIRSMVSGSDLKGDTSR